MDWSQMSVAIAVPNISRKPSPTPLTALGLIALERSSCRLGASLMPPGAFWAEARTDITRIESDTSLFRTSALITQWRETRSIANTLWMPSAVWASFELGHTPTVKITKSVPICLQNETKMLKLGHFSP